MKSIRRLKVNLINLNNKNSNKLTGPESRANLCFIFMFNPYILFFYLYFLLLSCSSRYKIYYTRLITLLKKK